jgi:hypothetical protein
VVDREKAQRILLEDEDQEQIEETGSNAVRVGLTGLTTTLIDYSLSRTSAPQLDCDKGSPSRDELPTDDIAPDLEQQLSIFHLVDPDLQFSVYRW